MNLWRLMPRLMLVAYVAPTAFADPIVVITWQGMADRQCFDRTLCRGENPWTHVREWQVEVDGVPMNPRGTLSVEVRPEAIRAGCGGFTNFGAIHVTCGTYPTAEWPGQFADFNNENYTGGGVYTSAIQCNRYGSFYGAGPDGPVWWWLATDGASGTIVIGAELADANFDGRVTVGDVFAYCERYIAGEATADINGDGERSPQDIFDFLDAYLS